MAVPSQVPAASVRPTTGAAPTSASSGGPSDTPFASSDTPSPAVEAASDCTGTAENRTFYGSVAAAVSWTVYCPVLPSGWFVEQGSYRLAGGGRLVITYRGPAGAHFTLREGNWCTDGTGCAPSGADGGTTAFGDHEGSLVTGSDGSVAIVVDAGAPVSWELAGDGLDEGTVRMFGAALIAVAG